MTTVQGVDAPSEASDEAPAVTWRRAARLWAVVACFTVVGIARSVQVGIPFRDPRGAFLVTRVLLTVAIFVGLVAVDGVLRSGRPAPCATSSRPSGPAGRRVGSRWPGPRCSPTT